MSHAVHRYSRWVLGRLLPRLGVQRLRLLLCFTGALSLAATGFAASAAAHPRPQRRSCQGLLSVSDFPAGVTTGAPTHTAAHGVYASMCSYLGITKTSQGSGTIAVGGIDELVTFPSSAAARAYLARTPKQLDQVARQSTRHITEGTPPFQTSIDTTVTSDFYIGGKLHGDRIAYDRLHTVEVDAGFPPGPPNVNGTFSSTSTTGYLLAKNQIFSVTLQNNLNPEVSTTPSQAHHLLVKVASEL